MASTVHSKLYYARCCKIAKCDNIGRVQLAALATGNRTMFVEVFSVILIWFRSLSMQLAFYLNPSAAFLGQ